LLSHFFVIIASKPYSFPVEDIKCIINLCITGAAICKQHDEELKSEILPERLSLIRTEIIQPRLEVQTKYSETFQKFLMHVCQSVHLSFEMKGAMLNSPAEILKTFIGWYSFCGDISEICLQSLLKAKEKLYKEGFCEK